MQLWHTSCWPSAVQLGRPCRIHSSRSQAIIMWHAATALLMCHAVICVNECHNWRCSAAESFRPHVENANKWHVFVSLVNKQVLYSNLYLERFSFFFSRSCIGVNHKLCLIGNTANREQKILVCVVSHIKLIN